jgi:hypothetical protein
LRVCWRHRASVAPRVEALPVSGRLYARVSTNNQQSLAMAEPGDAGVCGTARLGDRRANARGELRCREREARETIEAAGRREIDAELVWRLDRWGRSITALLVSLQEMEYLGAAFISLTEALDLTTPASANCTMPASANRRSPADCRSAGPQLAESWRPIPPRNRGPASLTHAGRKLTGKLSCPRQGILRKAAVHS